MYYFTIKHAYGNPERKDHRNYEEALRYAFSEVKRSDVAVIELYEALRSADGRELTAQIKCIYNEKWR